MYAGVREADGLPVVGKLVRGGARDLRAELDILQKVRGPSVVEALGVFESSEGPALVQRRFGQGSLADLLRGGALPLRRALSIGKKLADVLAHIHAARILHRDIKPANVLIDTTTDDIAVADFGIAVELPLSARSLPPSDLVGTPAYVSPEQTGRTREGCDARSDLYAFGVTLYQLLTGRLPFAAEDLLDLVAAQLSKVAEPPSSFGVPRVVSDIVMKLLAKAPDQRYQSARGVAADLARCLETLTEAGDVPAFALAGSDLVRPRVNDRVFGREAEAEVLRSVIARARAGMPVLCLVSGREGMGCEQLVRTVLRAEGDACRSAVGTFAGQGDRPLGGISDALSALVSSLLLLEDADLDVIRRRILARLGQIGQAVIDVVPAFGDLLGPQPSLSALGPAEARARLQHAFRCLFAALGEDLPLVLALEQVEHADPASMALLGALLEASAGTRFSVVLSASEERAFGALKDHPTATSVSLGPLSQAAITAWTAALLGGSGATAAPLAEVLYEKSAGLPGAFSSLLEHLVERFVIGRREGAYVWDLAEVRAAKAPPSLGALAAQRVAELAPPLRALLGAVEASPGSNADVLAEMVERGAPEVTKELAALAREGLIEGAAEGTFTLAHPSIGEMVRAHVAPEEREVMLGRLGRLLLRTCDDAGLRAQAFRLATALASDRVVLTEEERQRAAGVYALAAEQATASMAYDTAARFFARGLALLGPDGWTTARALSFRLEIGHARSLMMLAQHERAGELLAALCVRDLSPSEVGAVYPSRADSRSVVMDRAGAIDVGLEGLARLGFPMPAEPTREEAIAPLIRNGAALAKMSIDDHVALADAKEERAIAAIKIISTLSGPVAMAGRGNLYLLLLESGLELHLTYGYTRYYASFLSTHAIILHTRLDNFDGARASAAACEAVQKARPAPEIDGRTYLVLYYLIYPWLAPWREQQEPLKKGMQLAIEAGDPLFAALSASATLTLMAMCGAPFEKMVAAIDANWSIMKADAGVAANAGNVRALAGKLSRGEPIAQEDLDRISGVSKAAGAMRNNAMVNFGLALSVVGHEPQVRSWFEEVRKTFPMVNSGQPHLVTVWLLDGIFAAKDALTGNEARVADLEQMIANLKKLAGQTKTKNHEPAIVLLEAMLAEVRGELDRASGLYGRAAGEARASDLPHMVAFAMERRAELTARAGYHDDAMLFFREAALAYLRWGNVTKVRALEAALPELRTLDFGREATGKFTEGPRTHGSKRTVQKTTAHGTAHGTINESLDLATVLKVSQQISMQLSGAEVVRTVLLGIAQNAGAERVVFIVRTASGEEVVYGEAEGARYRGVGVPLQEYTALPMSAVRLARRTARPLIVDDAMRDEAHASDPFVQANQCRSIAIVPVRKQGELTGLVLLENRLVAGAFTPALLELTQALVAQAAISLDNASLYENMEARVRDRTAALNARNAEMRLVLDNVSQGLVMADREGRIAGEQSAIFGRWFGDPSPASLQALFAADGTFAPSWDQLIEGFLPAELCLDQLPKHLRHGEQIFQATWQPIWDGPEALSRMLLVLSDITEVLRQQEAEIEQKQMMAIFERLSHDQRGVVEFAREASNIVRELARAANSTEVEKRLVHTLKGNSAFFGLSGLSSLCHDVESAMIADERGISDEERSEIVDAWRAIETRLGRFLDVGGRTMQVPRTEFESALRALVREGHPVAHDLELWKLEALESRFQRIGEQVQALSHRLGKGPVKIDAEHHGIRVNGDAWAPLWAAFVHAVRNAVDHGLETPEEREAAGKGIATIRLKAYFSEASLVFEFADDGRGVAWEKVRTKAKAAGLPAASHEDLVAALFSDGVSTKDTADEHSGRGVGMSALRDACNAMGASIEVDSVPGVGTTFRFSFPGHLAKLPRERRLSVAQSVFPPN